MGLMLLLKLVIDFRLGNSFEFLIIFLCGVTIALFEITLLDLTIAGDL